MAGPRPASRIKAPAMLLCNINICAASRFGAVGRHAGLDAGGVFIGRSVVAE
jgi:hypothetical protein